MAARESGGVVTENSEGVMGLASSFAIGESQGRLSRMCTGSGMEGLGSKCLFLSSREGSKDVRGCEADVVVTFLVL